MNILRQAYPYYYEFPQLLRYSLLIAVFGFCFIYLFEPFNVNKEEHLYHYSLICLAHTIAAVGTFTLIAGSSNLWVKDPAKWTFAKEIFLLSIMFIAIGTTNFLIRDLIYDNPYDWNLKVLMEEIRNAFLVGTLIFLMFVPINFNRLNRKYQSGAEKLIIHQKSKEIKNPGIVLKTHNKNEQIHLNIQHFIVAKAEGNYVEIKSGDDNGIKREIARIPLKEMELHLSEYPSLFKCHRSYLVNLDKLVSVSGNAQGYQLILDGLTEAIPVARGRITAFEERMT